MLPLFLFLSFSFSLPLSLSFSLWNLSGTLRAVPYQAFTMSAITLYGELQNLYSTRGFYKLTPFSRKN